MGQTRYPDELYEAHINIIQIRLFSVNDNNQIKKLNTIISYYIFIIHNNRFEFTQLLNT